jgi:diguanylate cyclase (GGDEF)-like protein
VKNNQGVRRSRKPLLAAISRHLERQALTGDPATVVVGSFQPAAYFTPATARRYTALATTAALVAVFAEGMPAVPVPGVRGHDVPADDPMLQEWTIAVVGPHFAGALVARDVGDRTPEAERRFDYLVTYDRDTVVAWAALMMRRLGRRVNDVAGAHALRQQPSRLELLTRAVSATDNRIVIADIRADDMPLIYVNPGFERLTGYAAGTVTHIIGVQQNVTAQVVAEADVRRIGDIDSLTGLPNRTAGLREVERLLEGDSCGRDSGRPAVALAFCDLDRFKQVNDVYGHVVGDELLTTIARAIGECLTPGERVFRYDGDEFVVVVSADGEAVEARMRDLMDRIEVAVAGTAGVYGVGVSCGWAVHAGPTSEATALVELADQDMYRTKRRRQAIPACDAGVTAGR